MEIGNIVKQDKQEVDPFIHEVAIMSQLIREHHHRLDLLRELVSNSGAQEVEASNIRITYYIHPQYGHVFEVSDDGCGMNFTGSSQFPGRLDRFLGLGLSAVAGLEADEFSWKGLGAKLAYHSRRIEIETFNGTAAYRAIVNEPWQTIQDGKKPKADVSEMSPTPEQQTGTTVRVYGYIPHQGKKPLEFEAVLDYLAHRTFVGYTQKRSNPPKIILTVQNRSEEIPLGFPEFRSLPEKPPMGTVIIDPPIVVAGNMPGTNESVQVLLKGFYTWDDHNYGLADVHMNTGLILSVKGIPYFTLSLRELGSGQLAVANPGVSKSCLVVECNSVQTEMNISRSSLVDSAKTEHFKKLVGSAIQQVEDTQRHRDFRQVPKRRKDKVGAEKLKQRKQELERPEQVWVYWQSPNTGKPVRLLREPQNETDTLAILWKLEALGLLSFANFETLAYSGKGADLIVHFQEDESSNSERYVTMEAEYRFFNFRAHGHLISQFPTVICWDINPKPKLSVKRTAKPYKFVVQLAETTLRIYAIKPMIMNIPAFFIGTEEDLNRKQASEAWKSNL